MRAHLRLITVPPALAPNIWRHPIIASLIIITRHVQMYQVHTSGTMKYTCSAALTTSEKYFKTRQWSWLLKFSSIEVAIIAL